jgi:hypothetical protein
MFLRVTLACALVASLAAFAVAEPQETSDQKTLSSEKVQSSGPAKMIVRGEKIGDSPVVLLADIMKQPKKYENKRIVLKGTVDAVCQKKGCWMVLLPGDNETGVRVTFKDYGFFVPKDAKGFKVRAEGKLHFTTLSKEEADHLEEDGAKLVRDADGKVSEIGFVASGVELYKLPEEE